MRVHFLYLPLHPLPRLREGPARAVHAVLLRHLWLPELHDQLPRQQRQLALEPAEKVHVQNLQQPGEAGGHAEHGDGLRNAAQRPPDGVAAMRASLVPDPTYPQPSLTAPSLRLVFKF